MADILRISVSNVHGEPDDGDLLDTLYTADMEGEAFWSEFRVIEGGQISCCPGQPGPFQLHVLWDIPSFGRVYAVADHGGQGYLAGRDRQIHLNDELAASRIMRTRRRLTALQGTYTFSPHTLTRLEESEALLLGATQPMSKVQRLASLSRAHSLAAWDLEEVEVTKARQDVAALSEARQKRLRFGCNPFAFKRSQAYRQRFAQLWDFATVLFYREMIEPQEEQLDWHSMDETLTWLQSSRIAAKGHPLFWGHEISTPVWMKRLNRTTLQDIVRRQVMETVSRYRDRIKLWDVINEAHDWDPANVFGLSSEQQLEMTALLTQSVSEADAQATRLLNCCAPRAEYAACKEREQPMSPYRYLQRVQEHKIDFEVIGLQLYFPDRDMADISLLFDKFATLGKPIHITELGTPSDIPANGGQMMHPIEEEWGMHHVRAPGWWHGPWSQELQADWVEQFYLIALSKPSVEAITWWDFSDGCSFLPYAGLLDTQDQPKQAFFRLEQLLHPIRHS
jgi:endo-1,4-beta-xylanase